MLRGAVIGCGFFAVNHLHAWRMVKGARIDAICDQDPARLKHMGESFGITARYTRAEDLLAAETLDFVDIVTTVPTHRDLVELAIRRGVHVICQKPFANTLFDARAMVKAAEDADKYLMVHENFRWQSPIRKVIEVVRSGRLGTPFFCRASFRSGFDVFSGQPYLAEGARFIIEDLGIHVLDVARALMGNASHVAATTSRINANIQGEDVATILLSHASGMTSIVDCSYATKRRPETFPETLIEIDGDAGTLRLDPGYQLTLQTRQADEVVDVSPELLSWAERPWHNIQESVLAIQQHFTDCLRTGRQLETSGADNLETLKLVEAAYVSAAEKRTVATDIL